MGKPTFDDIMKLITMRGESKYGLSSYYIKLLHGKTVFDAILDRIGEMDLNYSSSTDMIFSIKTLKEEWKINYEFLMGGYGKNHLKQ